MNLNHLLQAGLELEKRIAQDTALRRCVAELWKKSDAKLSAPTHGKPGAARDLTVQLPSDVYELLQATAKLTGKSPSLILQESFALYWQTHIGNG